MKINVQTVWVFLCFHSFSPFLTSWKAWQIISGFFPPLLCFLLFYYIFDFLPQLLQWVEAPAEEKSCSCPSIFFLSTIVGLVSHSTATWERAAWILEVPGQPCPSTWAAETSSNCTNPPVTTYWPFGQCEANNNKAAVITDPHLSAERRFACVRLCFILQLPGRASTWEEKSRRMQRNR